MKLGKIFILVLSLLMLTGCTWPRIVYQPTHWTFDNRIIDIDDGYVLERDKNPKSKSHETFWLCEC